MRIHDIHVFHTANLTIPVTVINMKMLSIANVSFGSLGLCTDLDLGVGSGTIQDGHITASSIYDASTPAKNGRLNYTSGSSWCAGMSDTTPYLQIDLQTLHVICAVSTQGNSQADQRVKTYKLQLSTDGTTWTDYKEGGKVKVYKYCLEKKKLHYKYFHGLF